MKILIIIPLFLTQLFSQNIFSISDSISKCYTNSHDAAKEIELSQIAKYKNNVFRRNDSLFVKIGTDRFCNVKVNEGSVHFYEYYSNIDLFLIYVQYVEGNNYILVNEEDGSKIFIHNIPEFSENYKYFITTSFDLEAEYNPNCIQIWQSHKDSWVLVFNYPTSDWGPSDAHWINETTIIFKKNIPTINDNIYFYKSEQGQIIFKDDKWFLTKN